jgi:hypothetical protein
MKLPRAIIHEGRIGRPDEKYPYPNSEGNILFRISKEYQKALESCLQHTTWIADEEQERATNNLPAICFKNNEIRKLIDGLYDLPPDFPEVEEDVEIKTNKKVLRFVKEKEPKQEVPAIFENNSDLAREKFKRESTEQSPTPDGGQEKKETDCQCKNSPGWTTVRCCNRCGKSVESFWKVYPSLPNAKQVMREGMEEWIREMDNDFEIQLAIDAYEEGWHKAIDFLKSQPSPEDWRCGEGENRCNCKSKSDCAYPEMLKKFRELASPEGQEELWEWLRGYINVKTCDIARYAKDNLIIQRREQK